jgi:RimJ/RimL family protein N-acetyltransferase
MTVDADLGGRCELVRSLHRLGTPLPGGGLQPRGHRPRPRDPGFWAAEKASGQFLGWFHLRPPEGASPDEPELGYRLRRSAWGKGLRHRGSASAGPHGLHRAGARRVYAETMAVNRGSRRVMEKAGLRLVRTFHQPWPDRIEGDEHGDVEYALTRAEWERQEAEDAAGQEGSQP